MSDFKSEPSSSEDESHEETIHFQRNKRSYHYIEEDESESGPRKKHCNDLYSTGSILPGHFSAEDADIEDKKYSFSNIPFQYAETSSKSSEMEKNNRQSSVIKHGNMKNELDIYQNYSQFDAQNFMSSSKMKNEPKETEIQGKQFKIEINL